VPHERWITSVEDILESSRKIQRYTQGMTFDVFARNELVVDGVIRNFEIIGEAARQVPAEKTLLNPEIPWSRMIGVRNVMIHNYSGVSLRTVWDTIQVALPPLIVQLEALLAAVRLDEDDASSSP
jgi:uncharacterized protein with HEPN domain